MKDTLFYIGIVCGVLSGGFLITAVAMFFGFKIPSLWKDLNGAMAQKRIEEIRQQSSDAAVQRGKVNVFEELEKKAKVKKANTYSLNVSTTTSGLVPKPAQVSDPGTSVLQSGTKVVNPDFVIKKDSMFVSTNEVI